MSEQLKAICEAVTQEVTDRFPKAVVTGTVWKYRSSLNKLSVVDSDIWMRFGNHGMALGVSTRHEDSAIPDLLSGKFFHYDDPDFNVDNICYHIKRMQSAEIPTLGQPLTDEYQTEQINQPNQPPAANTSQASPSRGPTTISTAADRVIDLD